MSGSRRFVRRHSVLVTIGALTADRAQMLKMAVAARSARNVDAAARLAELCIAAGSVRA